MIPLAKINSTAQWRYPAIAKTTGMQKAKRAAAYVMIAFAIVSMLFAVRDIGGSAFAGREEGAPTALAGEPDGYYVVLFRGSSYCPTCDLMEKLSKELLYGPTSPFARDVKEGKLSFMVVNFEKPGNEHYLFDYDLYTTTIVLIEQRDGEQARWKNLQESWEHAEKTGDFKEYLAGKIRDFEREGR